ncbi:MAG: 30S ribosomal protein S16 [Clostridiales bacterium]|nr:30S ribosomal protein S16 [Clostridiales bacterium]
MAVKIRLKRMGANKKPFYRVVVADGRAPRDGRFIEEIGYYNPLKEPAEIKIDAEKAGKWLANGAQPTDTVKRLFDRAGIVKPAAAKEQAKAVEAEGTKDPAELTE